MFDEKLHCVLVDFQTARYLPIPIDVLMAIVCDSETRHQEKLFDRYVEFYYAKLSAELKNFDVHLESKMTFENFAKSCDYHKTFALVYNVIVLMITSIPRSFFGDFTEDEYRDFADGNRSRFVLDYMEKDSKYNDTLVEAVETAVKSIYKLS